MKRIFYILLFLPLLIFAQSNVTQTDIDGQMHQITPRDGLVYKGNWYPKLYPSKCWMMIAPFSADKNADIRVILINLTPKEGTTKEGTYHINDESPTYFTFDGQSSSPSNNYYVEFINDADHTAINVECIYTA